jgi:hypothetical protein
MTACWGCRGYDLLKTIMPHKQDAADAALAPLAGDLL